MSNRDKFFLMALGWALLLCFVFGCAPMQPVHMKGLENETLIRKVPLRGEVVTFPATVRGAYIVYHGTVASVCSEPAPDVALQTVNSMSAKLEAMIAPGQNGALNLSSETAAQIVQLAGRTQLVVLTREVLYRLCELTINVPEAREKAVEMYSEVLTLINTLAQANKAQEEACTWQAQNKVQSDASK